MGFESDTLVAPPPVTASSPSLSLSELLQEFSSGKRDGQDAATAVVEILAQSTDAVGVCLARLDASGRPVVESRHLAPPHLAQLPSLVQQLLRLAALTIAEQSPQAGTISAGDEMLMVAVPAGIQGECDAALCLTVGMPHPDHGPEASANLTHLLTWVAAFLGQVPWSRNSAAASGPHASNVQFHRALHALASSAAQATSLAAAARILADGLVDLTNVAAVAIGEYRERHDSCRLVSFSGATKIDARASSTRLIEAIMQEAIIASGLPSDEQLDWQATVTGPRRELQSKTGLSVVQSVALQDAEDSTFGALLLLRQSTSEHDAASQPIELDHEATTLLTSILTLSRNAELHVLRRLHQSLRGWYQRRTVWTAALLLSLVLLVPLPLRVRCPCSVEPRSHRLIAAPYDGTLKEALVEPGEIVVAGQVLVRMDDREIQWELSGLNAELRSSEKARDTALAAFDTVASQMADLEIERLRLRIDLLQDRLKQLEIRSPVEGMVLAGDLQKLEGARVPLGETILEVGSLDGLLLKLAIPDRDIGHVEVGQTVRCRLAALPGEQLRGQVDRIGPRSEISDSKNVFVAEMQINDGHASIRPGMRGTAQIQTRRHPLAWNLFHGVWEAIALWWM